MMWVLGDLAATRAAPNAWRSNAWRVISPVLESYCAWMMLVARFASTSAMRV